MMARCYPGLGFGDVHHLMVAWLFAGVRMVLVVSTVWPCIVGFSLLSRPCALVIDLC